MLIVAPLTNVPVFQGQKPAAIHQLQNPLIRDMVEKCLAPAKHRLSVRELLNHPFLKDSSSNANYIADAATVRSPSISPSPALSQSPMQDLSLAHSTLPMAHTMGIVPGGGYVGDMPWPETGMVRVPSSGLVIGGYQGWGGVGGGGIGGGGMGLGYAVSARGGGGGGGGFGRLSGSSSSSDVSSLVQAGMVVVGGEEEEG